MFTCRFKLQILTTQLHCPITKLTQMVAGGMEPMSIDNDVVASDALWDQVAPLNGLRLIFNSQI